MNGYFEKTLESGEMYKGHWKDGNQHGKGHLVYKSGKTIEGVWEHGKLISWSNYKAPKPQNSKTPKRKANVATAKIKFNPGVLF
jgi:hypothetical protein